MTHHQQTRSATVATLFRVLVVGVFAAFFLLYVILTWHWPFVGDAQVMHYVSFLIHHGFAPYRDIGDLNMPGAYLVEAWALAVFGPSNLGWRLYDISLSLTMIAAMVTLARRYDWIAGLGAAVVFAIAHSADGPAAAGQRDQVMAVLLVLSCACLVAAVRQRRPWLLMPFAFASTMAASIKPTLLPAGLVLLLLASLQLRRASVPLQRYWLYAIAGFLLVIALVVAFLAETHSARAFLYTLTQVIPHYGGLQHKSFAELAQRSLPLPVAVFALLGILAAIARGAPQSWEEIALLTCAFFGAVSYLAQGKGFPQHRYTFLAFLVLWSCLQLAQSLAGRIRNRCIAVAGILCCLLYLLPRELARIRLFPLHDGYTDTLEADLTHLGVVHLQQQIECLDIIDGCLTALYQLQIVQSTGSTGDLFLFQPVAAPAIDAARAGFLPLLQQRAPAVVVLSNAQFGVAPRSFEGKLATWPQFSNLLQSQYVLAQQRAFVDGAPTASTPGRDSADEAYRIYIRRDSRLLHPPAAPWPIRKTDIVSP